MSSVPLIDARSARWLSRRARNVARRQLRLALLSACGFIVALVTVIVVPRGVQRVARARQAPILPRRDTASIIHLIQRAESRLAGATAALASVRARATLPQSSSATAELPPELRARHDSLGTIIAELGAAVERASSSPLAASYEALSATQAMRSDPAVGVLMDSLAAVERARDEFAALGVVDSVYIRLTNRVASIGNELESIASQKSTALKASLAALSAPDTLRIAENLATDTVPFLAALDSAARELDRRRMNLSAARAHNADVSRMEAARRHAGASVPPLMILFAAAVLGAALGFLLSLLAEIRRPTVADGREAEVLTGAPVLAILAAAPQLANRGRRRADRHVPRVIELASDRYERLYFQLADVMSRLSAIAVTGDSVSVVATVAANLAAAAAHSARSTLLLDMDQVSRSISGALRIRATPGISDVLANEVAWPATLVPVLVGRDRTIDVIPAGTFNARDPVLNAAAGLRDEVDHFGRRYDTLVVSAPVSRLEGVVAVARAVAHSIVVVRFGKTRISELRRLMAQLRDSGTAVRGVVVWDREDPELLAPLEEGPEPQEQVATMSTQGA